MLRRIASVALVAALFAVAVADPNGEDHPLPSDCVCRKDVRCFVSLDRCLEGLTPYAYPDHEATICETAPSENTPWFSCWETPEKCLRVSNCTTPPPPKKCNCKTDIKCYKNIRDCRSQRGAITAKPGSNEFCLENDRPVYACWEEPEICYSSRTCEVIPHGGGNQDPHFRGFDGSQYYFDGVSGQDYNIISDASMQLNAHFIRLNKLKGTYMGRIGLLFGEHSLSLDPHFGVFYNGSLLTEAEVETPEGSFLVEKVDNRFRLSFENKYYQIVARVVVEKGEREEAYINLQATLIDTPEEMPHGILGQTARAAAAASGERNSDEAAPATFVVEGVENDYYVRDGLLGTDFTFNKFDAAADKIITVTGTRFRRNAAPLFEASAN